MPSLQTIEAKLDAQVKQQGEKAGAAAPKEPTQEEKDEERLREIEGRLTDLVDLLHQGATRDSADERVRTAKQRVDSGVIEQPREGGVVRRQHRDALALPLAAGQCVDGHPFHGQPPLRPARDDGTIRAVVRRDGCTPRPRSGRGAW